MENIFVQKVNDIITIDETIAIQIVIRYIDILGQSNHQQTDYYGNLQKWAKETRSLVSTFLSFRQFYQDNTDQTHNLLQRHNFVSPFDSDLKSSQIKSLFVLSLQTSQAKQNKQFLEALYNISLKKIKYHHQNLFELIELNPKLVSKAILKAQIFARKYLNRKDFTILKAIVSNCRIGRVSLEAAQLSQLFYLLGTFELEFQQICHETFQQSLLYNNKNMKTHKMIIKLYLQTNSLKKCLDHIETYRKSFVHSKYFLSIEALAHFLYEDSHLGFKLLHFIKEEIDADPENQKQHWYFNYCWGYLKYCMMECDEAYQYFQRQLKNDSKDANVVKAMIAINFRQQDYKSAHQLLDEMCSIGHTEVNIDASIFLAYICTLKQNKQAQIQYMRERTIHTIQHFCYQSKLLRYTPLYFGLLYSFGDYYQAIQQYEQLPFFQLSFFSRIQLKIVMLQCYSTTGQDEKVITLLGELQASFAGKTEDSALSSCLLYHNLLFLLNFCFERNVFEYGRYFAGLMKQNIKSMIKRLKIQDETILIEPIELPRKIDMASFLFRSAYE